MSRTEVKRILGQYRTCMAKVGRLELDKEIYKNCAASIDAEISTCRQIANSIQRRIEQIPDITYREVLIRRYIYVETNEQIADALCYSARHIQRIMALALNEYDKIQGKITAF